MKSPQPKGVSPVQAQPAAAPQQTSFLSTFKLVPVEKGATSKGDPMLIARKNVCDAIQEQARAVQTIMDGKPLPSTTFTVKGKERTRSFVKWFFERGGKVFTQVRYGQQSVFMDGDQPQALEVGTKLADLLPFYENLAAAVNRGELDDQLAPLQAKTSARMKGRKGKRSNGGDTRETRQKD